MSYFYGILYPSADLHDRVRVGSEFHAIGTAFATAKEAENQVMQEHVDVVAKSLPVEAFVVETDEYGVVVDYYVVEPQRRGRRRRHDNPTYAGMVPFFFSDEEGAEPPAWVGQVMPIQPLSQAPSPPPRSQAPSPPPRSQAPSGLSDGEIEVRLREAMSMSRPSAEVLPKEHFGAFARFLDIPVHKLPESNRDVRRLFRDAARERFGYTPSEPSRRTPSRSRRSAPAPAQEPKQYSAEDVEALFDLFRKVGKAADEGRVLTASGKPKSVRDAVTASDVFPLDAAPAVAAHLGMDYGEVEREAEASKQATTTVIRRILSERIEDRLVEEGVVTPGRRHRQRSSEARSESPKPRPRAPRPARPAPPAKPPQTTATDAEKRAILTDAVDGSIERALAQLKRGGL